MENLNLKKLDTRQKRSGMTVEISLDTRQKRSGMTVEISLDTRQKRSGMTIEISLDTRQKHSGMTRKGKVTGCRIKAYRDNEDKVLVIG